MPADSPWGDHKSTAAPAVRHLVQTYVEAWNESHEASRRRLLEQSWASRGTYIDPSVRIEGRAALVRHSGEFMERWPGARVELTSGILEHHGFLCFLWRVIAPDNVILREGIDFGQIGKDRKLNRVVGFFGPFPSRPELDPPGS